MKKKKYTYILIVLSLGILGTICYGVYYLQSSLQNIQYSKNDAHMIVLQEFQGTIHTSEVEFDNATVYYQFTVQDKQNNMIEVEISAKTGEITEFEYQNIE